MSGILPWVFGAFMLVGTGYFVFSIFFGDVTDSGDGGDGDFTLLLIAAFCSGFGAMGLLGTSSGWSVLVTVLVAAVFGYTIGKAAIFVLRWVMRQQTTDSIPVQRELIGMSARVTIESAPGKTGEAMIESGAFVTRSAVKEVNGVALHRGDIVEVVNVESGLLYVKKKNG
ncbi:MAG: hypothetical protein IPM16_11820 [Chloroflexi bacterium]|nr:hypothetical protein [Chloroflexota bacterium]